MSPGNVSLGQRYLRVEPVDGGLEYRLELPWHELAPVRPAAGVRMGVYYIMYNDNSTGHLNVLHWPVPINSMWTAAADRWGVLTLLEE